MKSEPFSTLNQHLTAQKELLRKKVPTKKFCGQAADVLVTFIRD